MPATADEAKAKGITSQNYSTYSSVVAADVPNDLAYLVDLRRRIRLPGNGPRGAGDRRLEGLRGRVFQRHARRRRSGLEGPAARRRPWRWDPSRELTRPAPRRDVLPRRRPVLPALAKLRQLPSGRPSGRPELGPDERRDGQSEEQPEHVAGARDAAVDGLGHPRDRRGGGPLGHHAHPVRRAAGGRRPGDRRLPQGACSRSPVRGWSAAS